MAFYNQDERFAESESISTDYDRGYGYGRGPRDDERFTETQITSYDYDYGDGDASDMPPPPQVPYPWRARWHAGRRTYEFINAETDERTFEFPGRRGYGGAPYEEQITTTTYVDEDAYRMAQDGRRVEGFPEEAARWAGERVQAVEDVPGDVEAGFDRLGRRVQRGYDDVVDAPEEVAGWAGRKVGDVERFGDEVDGAYADGRDERRYQDDRRYEDERRYDDERRYEDERRYDGDNGW